MKATAVHLLPGEGRAGCGEARVPALKKVGDGECVCKRKVGEDRGRVIDEKAEGVGHAWEGEGAEGREEKGYRGEGIVS
jgi:hypothetical protein